ncbi:MAG TPA: PEGA domain-containing protein, partial [Planctomycetota bacterium]|nr:PEGA domain-containing protein [Planctomycetota bacterium]
VPLALLLGACTSYPPVHFASDPPGARILIDGKDTGFVTPTSLNIPNKNHRTVEFAMPGYESAVRDLRTGKRRDFIFYGEWTMGYSTWRFPLWLNFQDFFVERKTQSGERPSRLFVNMKRKSSSG